MADSTDQNTSTAPQLLTPLVSGIAAGGAVIAVAGTAPSSLIAASVAALVAGFVGSRMDDRPRAD